MYKKPNKNNNMIYAIISSIAYSALLNCIAFVTHPAISDKVLFQTFEKR